MTGNRRDARQTDILFVISSLGAGGAERHLASLAAQLQARGWSVAVYSLAGLGGGAAEHYAEGIDLVRPPLEQRPGREIVARRALRFALAVGYLLVTMLRRRPQIIHFFLPASYLVGAPLAALARIPIRVMSRRSLNDYQGKYGFVRFIERKLHPGMTAVLGNSLAVVRQLAGEGVSKDRLGLIYNGVLKSADATPIERAVVRERLGLSGETITLIIVANLIPYKGHGDLIEALAKATRAMPRQWCLLVVGRNDGIQDQLQRRVDDLGLTKRVRFLGSRRDTPALLAAADIGLLVSHQEGFSNAILEGMAAGLPMIVTDVGGNAEAVQDGKTGLVVQARDPDRLAAAIVKLSNDPAARAAFGRSGQHRVRDCFSFGACIDRYERLYHGLLRGEAPRWIEGVAILETIWSSSPTLAPQQPEG